MRTMENGALFSAEMIAPCGLDCSLCMMAQAREKPCPGCHGPDENKFFYCSQLCGIMKCRKRKEQNYTFCDECPDYPCEDVMEKENRYTGEYPLRESPLENLKLIREKGMEAFLQMEKARWSCAGCGGAVSVHTGVCSHCGETKEKGKDRSPLSTEQEAGKK